MKSIYASKLYKASKRKAHIKAALLDTANMSLVQQLAESLDEEYQRPELLEKPESNTDEANAQPAEGEANEGNSGRSSGGPSMGGLSAPSNFSGGGEFNPESDLVDFPEGAEGDLEGDAEGDVDSDSEPEPSGEPSADEIAEATKVQACADITPTESDLNVLKGDLNLSENTAGVTRIAIRENEMWIYYNDDTNLNNIMTDVIDHLAKGCPYLEFNRLARSDNAIVFEMSQQAVAV